MLDKLMIYKEAIDKNINSVIDKEIKSIPNESVKESLEELKRLSEGGKRVRGLLIKIGQLLNGLDDNSYLTLATSFEIFQTAVLIHDDIIDEAEERRGLPTITSIYEGHNGLSKAICIGDLGFFLAYKLISESDLSSDIKAKIYDYYTKTLYNTVIGEIIDVELPLKDISYHLNMSEDEIYEIYINKTSWYTFVGPLLLGCISAKMDDSKIKDIVDIGINLGIAFQIKDDLLGLYSTKEQMGKTLNDIKENKQTIIYKYALDHANEGEREIIKNLYGKELDEKDTDVILNLFESLGAKDNALRLVEEFTNKAIKLIDKSDFINKEYLVDLANKLVSRNK